MTLLPFEYSPYDSLDALFRFACKTAKEWGSDKLKKEIFCLTSVRACKGQWCYTSPLLGILFQHLHAAQLSGPITPSYRIRLPIEHCQVETASALLHGWLFNPFVGLGIVGLHSPQAFPTVISSTHKHLAIEVASPSGTLGGGHVRDNRIAVYLLNRGWSGWHRCRGGGWGATNLLLHQHHSHSAMQCHYSYPRALYQEWKIKDIKTLQFPYFYPRKPQSIEKNTAQVLATFPNWTHRLILKHEDLNSPETCE